MEVIPHGGIVSFCWEKADKTALVFSQFSKIQAEWEQIP